MGQPMLAFRRLEPYDAKVSSTVLKGRGCGNTVLLPDNMLFSSTTKKISIINLGETAINHPFFSLAAFLKIPGNRYKVPMDSKDYHILHDTCFQGWLSSNEDLQKALELTEKLFPIYLLFAHMRLVNATCPIALGTIPRMNNRVKEAFLWFIKNLRTIR